jgi:hypothetical protein
MANDTILVDEDAGWDDRVTEGGSELVFGIDGNRKRCRRALDPGPCDLRALGVGCDG